VEHGFAGHFTGAVRGSRLVKAGFAAASSWLNRQGRQQEERPKRARSASGAQVRCAQCLDGTRSCVYCFGHGHTISQDGVAMQCAPCAGKGRTRCPVCKGEAFVRGY
jgi:hypothetical protein